MTEAERWQEAKRLYETSAATLIEIGEAAGVPRRVLSTRARKENWVRFAGAVHRPRGARLRKAQPALMIQRLYQAVERQLDEIEARMAKSNQSLDEKDARTLGSLARTLEKLIELKISKSDPAEGAEPVDLAQLYQELSERLHRLSESGG